MTAAATTPAKVGPKVTRITVADGDLEVSVTTSSILIVQEGPRGGRKSQAEFSVDQASRLRSLLDLAERHRLALEVPA